MPTLKLFFVSIQDLISPKKMQRKLVNSGDVARSSKELIYEIGVLDNWVWVGKK